MTADSDRGGRSTPRTVLLVVAGLAILVAAGFGLTLLVGALISDPSGNDRPRHPTVVGVRVSGDRLVVSSGRVCPAGAGFGLYFLEGGAEISSIDITLLGPTATLAFPDSEGLYRVEAGSAPTDWSSASTLEVHGSDPQGRSYWDANVGLEDLAAESSRHPSDEYYFGKQVGWSTAADVAARDGKDITTICSPKRA